MKVDCRTDAGAVRNSNQDSCDCGLFSPDSAWAIVCDGMGGARGGDVASTAALETMREFLISEFKPTLNRKNIKSLLHNAIARGNRTVFDIAREREDLRGMGTTAVLLIASRGVLHVAHVGDSRAYLKNKEGVSQITMDHSYVQDLVNMGQITQEEARVHPQRNIITRVLGVYEEVRCDYDELDFAPGDLAIACSDGLSNYMDNNKLAEYIEQYGEDGKILTNQLIRYAMESGGSDNITVAVIRNG